MDLLGWALRHGNVVEHTLHAVRTLSCGQGRQSYDVEELRRRRGGRPPMGSAASSVESVRLDPELKRDLLLRAAEDHISVSEVIRRAIGQYLRAA
ncbi:MAG: ribbon-helix-helix protein, CopG family [Actinomycetota bacterium]|nr:ribbon-helix-helix protein, CopG family [Actinomycetota bacterium]